MNDEETPDSILDHLPQSARTQLTMERLELVRQIVELRRKVEELQAAAHNCTRMPTTPGHDNPDGPCSCGAWHKPDGVAAKEREPLPSSALLAAAKKLIERHRVDCGGRLHRDDHEGKALANAIEAEEARGASDRYEALCDAMKSGDMEAFRAAVHSPAEAAIAADEIERLRAQLAEAQEERDRLTTAIRGHCLLLTGRSDHTGNPSDCLCGVHVQFEDLRDERDRAQKELAETQARPSSALLEAARALVAIVKKQCGGYASGPGFARGLEDAIKAEEARGPQDINDFLRTMDDASDDWPLAKRYGEQCDRVITMAAALKRIACLGRGIEPGNSDGNKMALDALESVGITWGGYGWVTDPVNTAQDAEDVDLSKVKEAIAQSAKTTRQREPAPEPVSNTDELPEARGPKIERHKVTCTGEYHCEHICETRAALAAERDEARAQLAIVCEFLGRR